MALSLITPAGANFIKDFPSQNEVNCDRIDDFAGPCLTSHALIPYTPVLSAHISNPTLGSGTIKGHYYKIFDQIYVWGEFRFGAGFAVGSGIYTMNLPFPMNSIIGPNVLLGAAPSVGEGTIWDQSSSAGRQPVVVTLRTSTLVQFNIRIGSGLPAREARDNGPITWAVDDGITWCARLQRQP